MARHVNRRIFLRGLGGACVAAPFLSSLGGRAGRAQEKSPPKRLIVMFTHNGCLTTRFFPANSHGPLTAADLEGTSLNPLARFVDKLLLPRGIRAMNEWTTDMTRGQGNDPHLQTAGSYFTCQPVTPNSNDPFSFDSATKFNAKPVGPSLDHVIAKQLSPLGQPLLVRVGNQQDSAMSAISYAAAETPYPGYGLPAQVFAELTGLFRDGAAMSPDSYQAMRGKSILDLVRDDLDTLERFEMSRADQDKLAAWKALLDDTGSVVAAQCNSEIAETLGATQANVAAWPPAEGDSISGAISGTLDAADLYSSLAALAAVCGVNPVIVLKYPFAHAYSALGINIDATSLNHRIGNAGTTGTCVDGVLDMLQSIDEFHARKFAHLAGLLDGIAEGDGKLLDHCATVWFQQMSDGAAHNLNNLPIVQVGGAGGYFKTGWAVNVEDGAPDLTRGNSEAYCGEDGPSSIESIPGTGTDPAKANAPINKYYCNLMNALGVKANAEGFPAVGGTGEVTHFGMYDKTEDFIGGGTNPAVIHDPGEFSALRASG
jgi:hypothetical protein